MPAVSSTAAQEITVDAVIIRADGTREELGTIAAYHSNPIKNLLAQLRLAFRKRVSGGGFTRVSWGLRRG